MIDFHIAREFSGTDAQEGHAVAVRLVHVRLDLEYECREAFVKRGDGFAVCDTRERGRRQFQKTLEERFHAEIRQCGAEENRGELTGLDRVLIEVLRGTVQKLDILCKLRMIVLADQFCKRRIIRFDLCF